ncbi:alcohol oxidase [Phlebopus sp. FC_14]|nr:alcohol oxidase [Phlebopus sp. FC_14]
MEVISSIRSMTGHIKRPLNSSQTTENTFSTGLGGSSAINFLNWSKPPAEEINDWERLGNPGWNWERYRRYLHKLEGYQPLSERSTASHRQNFDDISVGRDGPIALCHSPTVTEPELKVIETWLKLGIPRAPAPLNGNPRGVTLGMNTIDATTFTRCYATTAFFLKHSDRPNLSVLTSASVNQIVTRPGNDLTATGVEFIHHGKIYSVHATKEVILSAGALKSPQILELSGIGRRDVLEAAGIPVRLELPGVGENLQEHQHVTITYELPEGAKHLTLDDHHHPAAREEHLKLLKSREGAFTLAVTGLAFTRLQIISDRAEDIIRAAEDKLLKKWSTYFYGLRSQHEIQLQRLRDDAAPCELIVFPGFLSLPNPPQAGKKYCTIVAAVNHNFSRGSVHVTSPDPTVDPSIDPHYYEEDIDLQTFIEVLKFARKTAASAPICELLASPLKEVNPGPGVVTDTEIGDFIKNFGQTTYHTIGTLSMLPRDKGGFVDTKLKVYGTSNIRVVDISIAPLHIAAHTQSTAYAIAEQAADIIRGNL